MCRDKIFTLLKLSSHAETSPWSSLGLDIEMSYLIVKTSMSKTPKIKLNFSVTNAVLGKCSSSLSKSIGRLDVENNKALTNYEYFGCFVTRKIIIYISKKAFLA